MLADRRGQGSNPVGAEIINGAEGGEGGAVGGGGVVGGGGGPRQDLVDASHLDHETHK